MVKVASDPVVQEIQIKKDSTDIFLEATTDDQSLKFSWSLSGPGMLEGDTHAPSILYIAPDSLDEQQATATITVTVSDKHGEKASDSLNISLLPPVPPIPTAIPTPIPAHTPIPTAIPTVTPTIIPTAVPTHTPSPTVTPIPKVIPTVSPLVCPSRGSVSLDELLKQSLPYNLKTYQELKERELQGELLNKSVIASIEKIVCDLLLVEQLLEEDYKRLPNDKILKRIHSIRETRERYENERVERLMRYRR